MTIDWYTEKGCKSALNVQLYDVAKKLFTLDVCMDIFDDRGGASCLKRPDWGEKRMLELELRVNTRVKGF